MRLFHRFGNFLLFLLLSCLLAFPVFASQDAQERNNRVSLPDVGLAFDLPEDFQNTEGIFSLIGGSEVVPRSGVYETMIIYLGMYREDYQVLINKGDERTEEENAMISSLIQPVFTFICLKDGYRTDTLQSLGVDLSAPEVTLLETVDGYSHYLVKASEDQAQVYDPVFAEEYTHFLGLADSILETAVFSKPADPYDGIYDHPASFETTDLDGNPFSGEDLFSEHKYTLVNCWASWCYYCIVEMPELVKLNQEFLEKDCAVVGILMDGNSPDALESGKASVAENGVDYVNLLPTEEITRMFPVIEGYPTSFIVDNHGMIVSEPIIGADIDAYQAAMNRLLESN